MEKAIIKALEMIDEREDTIADLQCRLRNAKDDTRAAINGISELTADLARTKSQLDNMQNMFNGCEGKLSEANSKIAKFEAKTAANTKKLREAFPDLLTEAQCKTVAEDLAG